MYKKISDYGIIGNFRTIALIALDGSIDWLCLPHIDSPSIFGALLDDKKGGCWSICPLGEYDSVAQYLPETAILVTRFRTRTGILQLTDFMAVGYGAEEDVNDRSLLFRHIEVPDGTVDVTMLCMPRMDYARETVDIQGTGNIAIARGSAGNLTFSATRPVINKKDRLQAHWNLSKGEDIWLGLDLSHSEPVIVSREYANHALQQAREFWKDWLHRSETGRCIAKGRHLPMLIRSAITLKLLYYEPTGAIAAAGTTSLPEEIGGERNWDYRYTWIRDASFTIKALYNMGHLSETEGYLRWIESLLASRGVEKMQIMYGVRGETELEEMELIHLEGYKHSKPVRIGNGAATQKQLDIFGEIMDAALALSNYAGKIDGELWPFLRNIADYVVAHWSERDNGIWEVRGGPYHFVYSKVMCWVALDRGITIARRYGFPADLKTWKSIRKKIKDEVLKKGWNDKKKAFVQHYETDVLDSSNLLIPILGFLPFDDPRVISTIEAIRNELEQDGLLYRYNSADGLAGEEGTFLLCTFWLIDCLVARGELEEAERLLDKIERVANHLGLFAEEYDINWREVLGNFPQAFTHIGYINSAIALEKARSVASIPEKVHRVGFSLLLQKKIVLNDGVSAGALTPDEIAGKLKMSMNVLRGAFFDTQRGRVAYEAMKDSVAYRDYVQLSYSLRHIDLKVLTTREQQIAFWINLYNVMVIHGVIELGIQDSVKEVRNFFSRVQYRVGNMIFSLDDIEHGILRGNVRPPTSLFKLFAAYDLRNNHVIIPVDPRIHFALVCASSSCPPIEVYTAQDLDQQLDIAARTFLNAQGVVINKHTGEVALSRIFKWYGRDFGENIKARLSFILPYLYEEEDKVFIKNNINSLKVTYQDYDWRLNRY